MIGINDKNNRNKILIKIKLENIYRVSELLLYLRNQINDSLDKNNEN
jgi:hypothetical protein